MFTHLLNAMSICLQGTLFQRRSKKHHVSHANSPHWAFASRDGSASRPYVLTEEEEKLKSDFITKAHYVDNRLQKAREQAKQGQKKWFVGSQQQDYKSPHAIGGCPQVELYYKNLSLKLSRDPRTTFNQIAR